MRLHATWLRFLACTVAAVIVLLGGRDARACSSDYDCDVDYTCCGDGYCYYLSCPSSSGCSSDYDCGSGEGCCSDGTCDSACLGSSSSCLSSETDCGGYCCDSSFPVCCGSGACGVDSSCSACPSSAPNDCGDGWCCDDGHPYCCGDGTCSSTSDCSVTIGGSGSSTKVGINGGGPAPKQWGCAMTAPSETPWGTIASALLALVVVARARKRGAR